MNLTTKLKLRIYSFFKHIINILILLVVIFTIEKPTKALVLDMEISVDTKDKLQLENSIHEIHDFFQNQKGFINANLNKIDKNSYKLEEEWEDLSDYTDAISKNEFKILEDKVPGSSNWRAKDLLN